MWALLRIDPLARSHPEIAFVLEKNGKPADVENASVDTRVKPDGKLVIWLMGYSAPLFERLNSYALHATLRASKTTDVPISTH